MGKLTESEIKKHLAFVCVAAESSYSKDALIALLEDRLATLPEEAKPSEAKALWRETLPQGQAGWLSGNPFKEGAVVGKPQPERCGGKPGEPNWHWIGGGTGRIIRNWHRRGELWPASSDGPESEHICAGNCTECPGCADCIKPWHLQAAEAIWEEEREAGENSTTRPNIEEIAALILKYAPEARRQGEQPTSHHEPG